MFAPRFERIYKTGIDLKTVAATKIGTTEIGKRFVPCFIVIEIIAISGSVSVATGSVGTVADSYNDTMSATPLTGLTSVNKFLNITIASSKSIAGGTDIYYNVSVGAVATTSVGRVDIMGYYAD